MSDVNLVVTGRGIGRIVDGEHCLLDLPYPDVSALLAAEGTLTVARRSRIVDTIDMDRYPLLCPVGGSPRIWGVGLNYHQKLERTGRRLPDHPTLFLKPSGAATNPGSDIVLPSWASCELDYEAEIAVVIGRTAHRVARCDAWDHVAGITAANDLTARDVMRRTGSPLLAKGFDAMSPVGASLRTCDSEEFDEVVVRSEVNGEPRQLGVGRDLIHPVADLIERLSHHVSLLPGDVIMTGTPAGTGDERSEYLEPGDRIDVSVDGVAILSNRIVGDEIPVPLSPASSTRRKRSLVPL